MKVEFDLFSKMKFFNGIINNLTKNEINLNLQGIGNIKKKLKSALKCNSLWVTLYRFIKVFARIFLNIV